MSEEHPKNPRHELIRWLSISMLVSVVAVTVALCSLAIVTRTRFAQMFAEMDLELPSLTAAFISTPNAVFIALSVCLCAALIIKEAVIENRTATLCINVAAAICTLLCVPAYIIALYLPLVSLMERMGG